MTDFTEHKSFETKSFDPKQGHIDNKITDPRITHITKTLDNLQNNIEQKIEQKMTQSHSYMNEILNHLQRPALSGHDHHHDTSNVLEKKQYQNAFLEYMRGGNDTAIRNMDTKAYRGDATGADGGFLISPQMSDQIYRTMDNMSYMRGLAYIVTTHSNSVEFLVDPDNYGTGWVAETAARPETSTGLLRKITIPVHELYAMPKTTQRLLDDSAFNIEEWIGLRVAERFSQSENTAFISGDGVNKPSGFLSKPQVDNATPTWGSLGFIKTGVASGLNPAKPHDVLIDTVYALNSTYRMGATWIMNSKTAAELRKVKDVEGRYLWTELHDVDKGSSLLGYPVTISEDMPDLGTGTTPIAFGNFKRGYAIVESGDVRILRDPYTAKPHIFFYVVKRVGGDVIDFNAIKLIKCVV
jgi:HK97 family phage major capsid protein